jgi:hypothetical protein
MRSADPLLSTKRQPRSQSVPKRVKFADSPCFFEASPHRVFARPLTASDFPADVLDPPALCTPVRRSRARRIATWSAIIVVVLLFICLSASLAREWLAESIPPSSPLAAVVSPAPRQSREIVLGSCVIAAAFALLICALPRS